MEEYDLRLHRGKTVAKIQRESLMKGGREIINIVICSLKYEYSGSALDREMLLSFTPFTYHVSFTFSFSLMHIFKPQNLIIFLDHTFYRSLEIDLTAQKSDV